MRSWRLPRRTPKSKGPRMRPNQNVVVGQRLERLDGAVKATGRFVYGADFALPGTLHGKVLRSTIPHGHLIGIDVTRARALRGVRAVITSDDVPAVRYGNAIKDQTVFATDTIRFVGHALAAVAADTIEIAEQALQAITVEVEPLAPLFAPEAAIAPDAPLLHPDWQSYVALPVIAREGNIAGRSRMHHGDVDAAIARCYRVYEHRFTTALQHAGYTEPRAASAAWDSTGVLTVWSNG